MRLISSPESERTREGLVHVLVVDDHSAFRRVARALIEATDGFRAVGDAASGAEALRLADELRPDLVLMDVCMPDMDGFEAARELTHAHPECVVVLVSLDDLDDLSELVAASGAVAFVRKDELTPSLLYDLWTLRGTRPPNES